MGDTGKKYIPEGVFLTCNKGAGMCQLKIPTRVSPQLYGELWAHMMDATPMVNILPLGACSIIKGPCVPATLVWSDPVSNPTQVAGFSPLTETSTCQCSVGGTISIHFTRQAASSVLTSQEAKKEAEKAKHTSLLFFGAALLVGVAVIATGGAALAVVGPIMVAGAAGGAVAGAVHGGIEAYEKSGGSVASTIGGSLAGAVVGAAIGGVSAGIIAAGGPAAAALALGSMTYMGAGMALDVAAYAYNPTSENGLVLVGDLGDLAGILVGVGVAKGLSKPVEVEPVTDTDPPGTFRDSNGRLRNEDGTFAKDPNTVNFTRSKAARRQALLRDANDPNSNLTPEARQYILDNNGNKVPNKKVNPDYTGDVDYEVHHKQPLYTEKTVEGKQQLDVPDNLETISDTDHDTNHAFCGSTFHTYPR